MAQESSFLGKIDPLLQDKLANAPENEILRVVMRLSGENKSDIDLNSISPADFPNRIEYRKALIAARQQQLAGDIGATKQALENLALKTYGGENTRSLVVEGTVNQILQSLELSGIESANLDRGFTPIVPVPYSFELNALEPIFLEIAEKAKLTSKTTPLNRIPKLLGWSDSSSEERTKKLINQASQQYTAKYYKEYGTLKVLGMKQPVSLESIYTNVRLLPKSEVFCVKNVEELEKIYRNNNRQFYSNDSQTRKGLDLANQEQYLMVVGAPGAGKSTLLKKIALETIKGKKGAYEHFLIPVFIELKRCNQPETNFFEIIAQEFDDCGFPQKTKYVQTGLKAGNFLVLLDGLDEVPTENLEAVILQLNIFMSEYPDNRFIISCRTALNQSFSDFTEVIMADFDNTQIQQFISNWFSSDNDKQGKVAEKCWQLLKAEKNKDARELAQTPLLLTFLCLIYERAQNFPNNRSELYSKALRILLEEWAAEKRIGKNEIYRGLDTGLEQILLSEIAYDNFIKDKLFFQKEEIIQQIEFFPTQNIHAPERLNGEAVLNAIALQQGILVERANNIYSFSHLTLQEYLTAQYIKEHNLIESLVSKYVTDKRWKEVFLLVAGLMQGGADELLLLMEQKARDYLKTSLGQEKLIPLLNWAHTITTEKKENLNSMDRRSIAISTAYAIAKFYDKVNNYDNSIGYINSNILWSKKGLKCTISLYDKITHGIVVDKNFAPRNLDILTNNFVHAVAIARIYIEESVHAEIKEFNNVIRRFDKATSYLTMFDNDDIRVEAINLLIDSAYKLSNLTEVFQNVNFKNLISELEDLKTKFPNINQLEKIKKGFAKEFALIIIETWLSAFHLSPDLIQLSEAEVREIDNQYYYINRLILECKEAAVKVSPKTWNEIEERMLRA